MTIKRRKAKIVKIGNLAIGGANPIVIQSMVKTKASDVEDSLKQIKRLAAKGCEVVRLAIKDNADAKALKKIKQEAGLPLVADIHFNWRLAIAAIDNGVDKIRLNPGNIYKKEQIREVVRAAKLAHIPIRIGVNSGSLRALRTAGALLHQPATDKMIKDALDYIKILEGFNFYDTVISLKASNVLDTVDAYSRMAKLCDYPLHLGVTATGPAPSGIIKSSIALGSLLLDGIGDTIRVSLTDRPEEEVKAAQAILEALSLRSFGPDIISCPTCGRCEVDLVKMVKKFENKLNTLNCKPLTVNSQPFRVALMGCVVNGPGEAREADIGIAFGKKEGLLFKSGKPLKKVMYRNCISELLKELHS